MNRESSQRQPGQPPKLLLVAGLAAAFALTLAAARGQNRYAFTAPARLTEQSYSLGQAPFVKVDGVNGDIRVVGDGGAQVRLTATEHIRAGSPGLLAQAAREVTLQLSHTGDSLSAYVDGPFRCQQHCHWDNPGYQVRFDFVLHVPAAARLDLRTVNGNIAAGRVAGDFQLHSVNGNLDLSAAAGSGEARTVNGTIHAAFAANPRGACTFRSLNGGIHLYFQPRLDAVLRYQTFHGAVYSDFPAQPLPGAAMAVSHRDGKSVYSGNRFTRAQIGAGGPVITLNGFNGDIFIHRAR